MLAARAGGGLLVTPPTISLFVVIDEEKFFVQSCRRMTGCFVYGEFRHL